MTNNNFTHLHVHTWGSFLDGISSPKALAERASELGMTSLAMTDHNHTGIAIDFQASCVKAGIKPILGLEGYWTKDTATLSLPIDDRYELATKEARLNGVEIPEKIKKKELKELLGSYMYTTRQSHVLFLAKNQTGWRNMVKLQSESAMACTFNGRFLCDDNLLKKYAEGLIMTTACIGNALLPMLENEQREEAEKQLLAWQAIFGDDFYPEIQPLNIPEQYLMNLFLIEMADKHGLNLVATNDVHYTLYEDHDDHDTLLCIGTGNKKEEEERIRYSNDFWLKSYDEMIECFETQMADMSNAPENYMEIVKQALANTNTIAAQIQSIKIGADTPQLPQFNTESTLSNADFMVKECYQALYAYKKKRPLINLRTYEKRLRTELDIINTKGFGPYMLIVQDYIKNSGCPTGPGRGSGAGSLVLFLMGITKVIDPIEHGLLFSRFLTMDRTAMPDCKAA